MNHRINLVFELLDLKQRFIIGNIIKKCIRSTLKAERINVPCEINVLVTDDAGIQVVNRESRKLDKPTDVLSFPIGEMDYDTDCLFLGDVVLSLERADAQGQEYGGGYDHLDEGEEKARMRAREKAIMKELGYDF